VEKLKMTRADYSVLAKSMRKVEFFAPMTVGELDLILPYILLRRFSPGERVFKHGDPGDAFYIVYDGRVSVRVKTFLFFTKPVANLKDGDFFGEMALLSDEPRNASVYAAEEGARLFILLSADFKAVLRQNPQFKAEMEKMAERRKYMSRHES